MGGAGKTWAFCHLREPDKMAKPTQMLQNATATDQHTGGTQGDSKAKPGWMQVEAQRVLGQHRGHGLLPLDFGSEAVNGRYVQPGRGTRQCLRDGIIDLVHHVRHKT